MGNTLTLESDAVEYFYERGWTDGLPIVPPTLERVSAMLDAAGLADEDVLGVLEARNQRVTAGIVAVNAVMAGCRAEYFPVVVAAVEAMLDPALNIHSVSASTGGSTTCIIVSGPLAATIGMNSRGDALGAGNRANATIGRAARLVVVNVFGAKSGLTDASSLGHPGKYSFCFAEDPPPEPWHRLSMELGFEVDDTTVTVMATEGPRQIAQHLNEDPVGVLLPIVAAMRNPSMFIAGRSGQAVVVLGHEHSLALRQAGWTQLMVREFLAERSRLTPADVTMWGLLIEPGSQYDEPAQSDGRIPVVGSPNDIVLVTAGGPGSGWSTFIPAMTTSRVSRAVTRRVRQVWEPLPDCGEEGCDVPWIAEIKPKKVQSETGVA